MLGKLGKRAQTTAEYAILIAIVVGAVVAMQVYVRRGLQGRVRDVVDHVADAADTDASALFSADQYEPYYLTSNATTYQTSNATENLATSGSVARALNAETTVNRAQEMGWGNDTTSDNNL